jgi:hypothetical protein
MEWLVERLVLRAAVFRVPIEVRVGEEGGVGELGGRTQSARTGSSHKLCKGRGSQPGRGKGGPLLRSAPISVSRSQTEQASCQNEVKTPYIAVIGSRSNANM